MFGISTFCLHREPLDTALDTLAAVTDYVEVMDEGLHFLHNPDVLENYSIKYSVHAPSRGTNLASLLEPIRRASVEVISQCFAVAAEVNADVIVHPGYFAWEEERKEAEDQFRRSREDLLDIADEFSVAFSFENMGNWPYFLLKTPDELSLLGKCGFALDVGHAHQNHCLDGFLPVKADHYHLHDNNAVEDTHDPVGAGTIDFALVMDAVKKSGINPVIEVASFKGTLQSITALKKI
ncbi:MAG: endonuclease IV [Methanoregula sp. PtaU1.Bin051]|nr:MAG: endonuclease IV [Methanoregula sp. PtaU1.Bin051]